MRDVETRVLDAIDETEAVNLLAETVRVPSITGTAAESELQHRLAALLTESGMDVDLWRLDLDDLCERDGFPGTEAPRTDGYGLVGVMRGDGGPALALQGPADVVPSGDLATWEDSDPSAARATRD